MPHLFAVLIQLQAVAREWRELELIRGPNCLTVAAIPKLHNPRAPAARICYESPVGIASSRTGDLLYHGQDDNNAHAFAETIIPHMRRVLPPLFLAIGLGVWAAAAYLYTNTRQLVASGEHARGIVVALSRSGSTYSPVVAFKTADGAEIEFVGKVGTSSPRFVKGQQLDVLYRPENPKDAHINAFLDLWGGPAFLTIFGAIFSLIGSAFIFVPWKTRHMAADLRVHGTPILAEYQHVALNPAISVNGASPYRIFVQWQDPTTSQVHVFHSDDIWYDPGKFINRKELTVYVDPSNLKRYHVDISFLPPGAT